MHREEIRILPGESEVLELLHQLQAREEGLRQDWDESYLGEVLARALGRLRPQFADKTWQAFEKVVLREQPPKQVSADLRMSLNAVYNTMKLTSAFR
jgi:hypothetical protein